MHLIAVHPLQESTLQACISYACILEPQIWVRLHLTKSTHPKSSPIVTGFCFRAQQRTLRSCVFIVSPCSSKAMNSAQSFASSVNCVDQYYPEVSAQDEVLQRPKQTNNAIG